ncbi:PD-(D/E)XK nuclease family protein [bacterium]|nr:PD-(D/E)XK nuclease family protein [bacterium]
MQDVSFFTRLSSYSPRAGRNPREDFFTEALAWLLNNEPNLAIAYAQHMWSLSAESADRPIEPLPEVATIEVETQVVANEGRPDMVMRGYAADEDGRTRRSKTPAWIMAFEHKLDAGEGTRQLHRYACYLCTEAGGRSDPIPHMLVYITRYHNPNSDNPPDLGAPFQPLRWRDVYNFLTSWDGSVQEQNKLYFSELIKFMEEQDMAPVTGFSPFQLATIGEINKTLVLMDECMSGLAWEAFLNVPPQGCDRNNPGGHLYTYGYFGYGKKLDQEAKLRLYIGFGLQEEEEYPRSHKGYPELFLTIESDLKKADRQKHYDWIKELPMETTGWRSIDDSPTLACVHTSLANYTSHGEHQIDQIQNWFAGHLRRLSIYIKAHPVPL